MSRKIKFHTFHFLFRLFAYMADKSGGWRVFVRPKLLLGSLIVGLGLTGNTQLIAQNLQKTKSSNPKVEQTEGLDTVSMVTDQAPQFPEGDAALLRFIGKNLIQPPVSQCYNGVMGKVICRFVVEKDGGISNITVIKSLDSECDKEAVRVLKLLPKFIPAKYNGQNVRAYYTLPVTYRMD